MRHHASELLATWQTHFERSPFRTPREDTADLLRPVARAVIEALIPIVGYIEDATIDMEADMTSDTPPNRVVLGHQMMLAPGDSRMRELEKTVTFLGANATNDNLMGFDLGACMLAMRETLADRTNDALARQIRMLFEWLTLLLLDAYATAGVMAEKERNREILAHDTPVVLVSKQIPAALLVGRPDNAALDAIFGRIVTLVVTNAAPVVIIDATGLREPCSENSIRGLRRLANHDKISDSTDVFAIGLSDDAWNTWHSIFNESRIRLHRFERFRDAYAAAVERVRDHCPTAIE